MKSRRKANAHRHSILHHRVNLVISKFTFDPTFGGVRGEWKSRAIQARSQRDIQGQVEKLKLLDVRMKLIFETGLDCQFLTFK